MFKRSLYHKITKLKQANKQKNEITTTKKTKSQTEFSQNTHSFYIHVCTYAHIHVYVHTHIHMFWGMTALKVIIHLSREGKLTGGLYGIDAFPH